MSRNFERCNRLIVYTGYFVSSVRFKFEAALEQIIFVKVCLQTAVGNKFPLCEQIKVFGKRVVVKVKRFIEVCVIIPTCEVVIVYAVADLTFIINSAGCSVHIRKRFKQIVALVRSAENVRLIIESRISDNGRNFFCSSVVYVFKRACSFDFATRSEIAIVVFFFQLAVFYDNVIRIEETAAKVKSNRILLSCPLCVKRHIVFNDARERPRLRKFCVGIPTLERVTVYDFLKRGRKFFKTAQAVDFVCIRSLSSVITHRVIFGYDRGRIADARFSVFFCSTVGINVNFRSYVSKRHAFHTELGEIVIECYFGNVFAPRCIEIVANALFNFYFYEVSFHIISAVVSFDLSSFHTGYILSLRIKPACKSISRFCNRFVIFVKIF